MCALGRPAEHHVHFDFHDRSGRLGRSARSVRPARRGRNCGLAVRSVRSAPVVRRGPVARLVRVAQLARIGQLARVDPNAHARAAQFVPSVPADPGLADRAAPMARRCDGIRTIQMDRYPVIAAEPEAVGKWERRILFRRSFGIDIRCLLARFLAYRKSGRAANCTLRVADESVFRKTHIDSTTTVVKILSIVTALEIMRSGLVL